MLPAPTSTFAAGKSVAGTAGNVWLGLDNGKLYRSTGAAFNEVTGLPMPLTAEDLYVTPGGKVFAVSSSRASISCVATDCSVGANFVADMTAASSDTWNGLCGRGETVYGIADRDASIGVLYSYTGGTLTKLSNNLGVTAPRKCEVSPSGDVFVVANEGVVRYSVSGASTSTENIDLQGHPAASWNSIALTITGTTITEAMIVGGGSGYRFARRNNATNTWVSLPPNTNGSNLNAVIGVRPTEFLAAGSGSLNFRFMSWNGTVWAALPVANQPPNSISMVRDAIVISDREVYLVGSDTTSSYAVIRGTR